MANSTEQTNQNSGQGAGNVGQGVGRDVNASIGLIGDITPDLSNLAASTATSTSGAVTVGDRILGGSSKRQFGLVKILAVVAGIAIFIKIFKSKGGK